MKNHIVAPRALARNWCLKPGKWGWNPEPVEPAMEESEESLRGYDVVLHILPC